MLRQRAPELRYKITLILQFATAAIFGIFLSLLFILNYVTNVYEAIQYRKEMISVII